MKKILMVFLVIAMVFAAVPAFGEQDYSTIESVLTLAYGEPYTDYGLAINEVLGETEEVVPDITALYLFISEDGNILQYLDEQGSVMTWAIDTSESPVAGIEMLIWLFDEVDMAVFFDVVIMDLAVGSSTSDSPEVPTTPEDFLQDIMDMYSSYS